MKIGIDSYCYHRYFGEIYGNQTDPGKRMTYEDFLNRAIELGVDGVSLETCFFETRDDDYFKRLKEIIDRGNLEVVVAWGHLDGLEGGTNLEAAKDMESHFHTCDLLGAKVMRMVGSSLSFRNDPHRPQMERIAKIMKESAKRAEDRGIKFAMENHFDFTADEFLEILEDVGSDHFGMTYDTGNALRIGDEPVKTAEKLAKHIIATHTKDIAPVYGADPQEWDYFASVPVGKGVVNMPGLIKVLEDFGYDGLFAIEIDYLHPDYEDEDPGVAESVEYLKQVRQSL
ncbi:MAG: sugar phosphate isomerase/epimerase [Candidatus Nealsonbacteria bacterium]|nr:sugar phosphate isomerase/epimerase [Candidatus Nealsonbacteria bacterium]